MEFIHFRFLPQSHWQAVPTQREDVIYFYIGKTSLYFFIETYTDCVK